MIDKQWIGHELPVAVLPIEAGRLKFFAQVTGETDPVYLDEAAACAAGHAALPAPPTFLFAAELDTGGLAYLLQTLQVPLESVLHGEQGFTYHHPVYAGDTITVRPRITDIVDKKNGALEFITKTATAHNQHGQLVAELRSVVVVRH